MDLLKKNPGTAIPVVLSRLQQKDGEWRKVKQDMKPLFSKVFQQNYHKSLDHRSFYFKQTDKKTLGHKAMIQVCSRLIMPICSKVMMHNTVHLFMLVALFCQSLISGDISVKASAAVKALVSRDFIANKDDVS